MAAAAFTETLVFRGSNGRAINISATVSDVANEYAVFPDGNSFLQLPSDAVYSLIDIIVDTGGTDTKFQEVYANQMDTGLKIANKSNLTTSNYRQFQQAPVGFKPGSLLRLKQLTS